MHHPPISCWSEKEKYTRGLHLEVKKKFPRSVKVHVCICSNT